MSNKDYVVRNNVQFVGFNCVHPDDQKRIKDIIFKDYITLERELKKINKLKLHFKCYEKGGKKKYSVQLFIDSQYQPITVNKMSSSAQWDPVTVVHKVLDKARQEINHKLRNDTSWKKEYTKGSL